MPTFITISSAGKRQCKMSTGRKLSDWLHFFCSVLFLYRFFFAIIIYHDQSSKLKKNPGCLYFKSRATKAMKLVALMNPWLPSRKTYTFKWTTQKNIHFCFLSAFNYMLTLPLLSIAQNQRGLNWTELQGHLSFQVFAVLDFFFPSRSMHPSRSI